MKQPELVSKMGRDSRLASGIKHQRSSERSWRVLIWEVLEVYLVNMGKIPHTPGRVAGALSVSFPLVY
jgi:hypothetical protein